MRYVRNNIWHRMKKRRSVEERMAWAHPLLEHGREREERLLREKEHPTPPEMMHVVRRVKKMSGRPWWEKKVMEELQLDGNVSSIHSTVVT